MHNPLLEGHYTIMFQQMRKATDHAPSNKEKVLA